MRAWVRAALVAAVLAAVGMGALTGVALGDGDPGSDVLVYQNLFVAGDAGMPVAEQAQLGALLKAADRGGFPVRVAVISSPADLGAVTGLWHKPQAYARFLGYELSLSYRQRLLVVMPNGFGFNWPGHSTAAATRTLAGLTVRGGGAGLFAAASSAVHSLAAASGVRLTGASTGSAASTAPAGAATAPPQSPGAPETVVGGGGAGGSGSGSSAPSGQGTDALVAAVTGGLFAVVVLFFGGRYVLVRRRRGATTAPETGPRPTGRRIRMVHVVPVVAVLVVLAAALPVLVAGTPGASGAPDQSGLTSNPYLDPGTKLTRAAPDFTLINQFGRPVSLHSFRGKVVLLAFTDSECTTTCPMTTTAMLDAKAMLGAAGQNVALVGVDANPASTSIEDVASYSELHGMTHAWNFLTGSLPELRRVWKSYGIDAAVQHGLVDHTPALVAITPQGREAKLYVTQQSYSAVGQLGQIVAQEASSLLPGHPRVNTHLSYATIKPITPAETTVLPRSGGGTVTLGPGRSAHLYVFYATWDQEITSLGGDLDALNRYAAAASAAKSGLPPLTAVDEGQVEPSRSALPNFLGTLAHPLAYPTAIDRSGQVADGYEVLGQPWFVLASPTGRILWYQDVSTSGWPSESKLIADVRAALARAPSVASGERSATAALAGSPTPLAGLHQQAGQLLGSQTALNARVRALRGYPVVINAWASWCTPCRSEFGLFAAAAQQYGRKVAFIGANTNDSAGDARAFLSQHPVSYPSYQTNTSDLRSIASVFYLPTTIFINRSGKVVQTHLGQYDSQGSLDGDIATYALGSKP